MASFPFMPMAVLTVGLLSAWIVQLGVIAYAGYMVRHLGIVEDKDQAGEFLVIVMNRVVSTRPFPVSAPTAISLAKLHTA
ncbi:unnamed protein product [Ectocarpus sp. CCAP 1310/34]|nr:unnamed protein product [Ectocarpus sp. CCAP 1310/34]